MEFIDYKKMAHDVALKVSERMDNDDYLVDSVEDEVSKLLEIVRKNEDDMIAAYKRVVNENILLRAQAVSK